MGADGLALIELDGLEEVLGLRDELGEIEVLDEGDVEADGLRDLLALLEGLREALGLSDELGERDWLAEGETEAEGEREGLVDKDVELLGDTD
jgi:hypothetical protein